MAVINVKDQFRTNPLSHQPGGYHVSVTYEDGLTLVYDKVKKPGPYVRSIEEKGHDHGRILEIKIDGTTAWDIDDPRQPWEI
jgi:hypothetical protein